MANTDYTKMMKDMMSMYPMDMSAFEGAMKSSASFTEKMAHIAIEAADKSTEISTAWTKSTLAKMGDLSAKKDDPSDYSKAMTDFASAQAESAAEHMSAYAEVAKKVQMDTVDLMMAAGKDMGDEASAVMKKAQSDMTKATKKAAASTK